MTTDSDDHTTQLERKLAQAQASANEWRETAQGWEDLAGEWQTRARRALEGMRGANSLTARWRKSAWDLEARLTEEQAETLAQRQRADLLEYKLDDLHADIQEGRWG